MNDKARSIPAHFGDMQRYVYDPHDHAVSPIIYRLDYINHLPVEVVVVWRSGLKFRLPPNPVMGYRDLIVRMSIYANNQVRFDMERVLSEVTENSGNELKAMRDAFSCDLGEDTRGCWFTIDYGLTLEKLHAAGGTVYYHELDCLISVVPFEHVPPHPYSEEGMRQQIIAGSLFREVDGFCHSVEIIDNSGRWSDRFLNVNGRIARITPKKDCWRRNGVYVLSNRFLDDSVGELGLHMSRYPLDASTEELLGLYRSYEEALSLGDLASKRKEELVQSEHELQLMKQDLSKQRAQHEAELSEKNKELKELELEVQELKQVQAKVEHNRDLERSRVKDYYEDRSYSRKDQSEAIKFIPSIIVGIGAAILAIKTFL